MERALASGVAAGLERLIGLFRSLSPPDGLSLTAAATLATLERSGPRRLTALAAQEGVTQPAMTQLIARLQDSGLADRDADPADGRVVQVRLTEAGREMLARRRAVRAERLAVILARISPEDQAALAAALPAIDALTSAQRDSDLLAVGSQARAGRSALPKESTSWHPPLPGGGDSISRCRAGLSRDTVSSSPVDRAAETGTCEHTSEQH